MVIYDKFSEGQVERFQTVRGEVKFAHRGAVVLSDLSARLKIGAAKPTDQQEQKLFGRIS